MVRIELFSEDRTLLSLLSSALGQEFEINLAHQEEWLNRKARRSDVVLLFDLDSLPEGLDFFQKTVALQIPIIALASDPLRATAEDLVRQGAYGYCRRPPSVRDLKTMLVRAHESSILRRELLSIQQREAIGGANPLVGTAPQMQRVYDLMQRVANINASVLVTGESGTGKELIATGIHNLGARAERPFVAVCCGAIPESLIEAELFGHEKGAFTGTVGARVGYLEQAGDGTLFLDEIGELNLATQVKLLRVLQQREFSRLGSNRLLPLRARLIFATHQNLTEMVALGTFRQDLFYRINVVRIDAPPLREHPEDVPPLAEHFLQRYSAQFMSQVSEIDPCALAALQGYSWPGNVRELENVIQRAIVSSQGKTLQLEDLPSNIQEESIGNIDNFHPAGSFERQLRNYKIKLAMTALRENKGNKTLAARSLNISRAYLHRLIRVAEPDLVSDNDLFDSDTAEAETAWPEDLPQARHSTNR